MPTEPQTSRIEPAGFVHDSRDKVFRCTGDWTLQGIGQLERRISRSRDFGRERILDGSGIRRLDTAGALLLERLRGRIAERPIRGLSDRHAALLSMVAHYRGEDAAVFRRSGPLTRLGKGAIDGATELMALFTFVGRVAADSLPQVLLPARLRWKQVFAEIEHAGVRALPILGMLAFLTGVVIAYQGGTALEQYGANIFIVDLLTITMLREMAPLITAIIVAGRTGSAYTAQIGTMKITQEIDALRALGMSPVNVLILPKVLALLLVLPLLTLFADGFGMLGGILVADIMFGVGYQDFLQRVPAAVAASHFWVGIAKGPVFAALIVTVSCYQGFAVQGSTESVGRSTTRSVVQSIFLVIVADAVFSVLFNLANL